MTRKIASASALIVLVALVGCNTVSGAGKDVSSAGKAVTKAAEPIK